MANIFKRKGTGIMTAVISFGALVMIVMALVTRHWVTAALLKKSGNTTTAGGTKSCGLFDGYSAKNYGLGHRERLFKGEKTFPTYQICIY
jgi:hypothetical protein